MDCRSVASGVVRTASNLRPATSTPIVPIRPVVKPDNCHSCLTKLALVVFPFVPVMATAVNVLKGESLNHAANAPTSSLGFSR